MDEDSLIATTVDQSSAYTNQVEFEDGENALFVDFLVLHVSGIPGDTGLNYWIEESNDGMSWKEIDRVNGLNPESGDVVSLMSSMLGGVFARVGFTLVDLGGGGTGDITLRVSVNPTRR